MRADLQTMEQIDLYLQGKLSSAESAAFENSMATNPELNSMVADQQLLAQTVSRKALLAEIHAVAGGGGGPWYSNPYLGFAGATVVIGIIVAAIYFNSTSDETILPEENNISQKTTDDNSDNLTEEAVVQYPMDTVQIINGNRVHQNHNQFTIPDSDGDEINEENIMQDGSEFSSTVSSDGNNPVDNNVPVDVDRRARNKTASFPNGYTAMRTFVSEKMIYPGTAKKEKIQGNVVVKFLVGKEGQISTIESNCFKLRDENDKPMSATQMVLNAKIVKIFEERSAAIIRTMPAWEPATDSQGNNVVSMVTVYFNFSLKDGISIYQLDEPGVE